MEPRNRKVNWRRRQALFLLEFACMVGLCGLGYPHIAIALGVLIVVAMLDEAVKSAPRALYQPRVDGSGLVPAPVAQQTTEALPGG
jgi:hypothetical protein